MPTTEANAFSAEPPVRRRRCHASLSAAVAGTRSPSAFVTTSSTQPSTRAKRVSSRVVAPVLRDRIFGSRSMPCIWLRASWIAAGSCDSRLMFRMASSMAELSNSRPAAYSSTEETRRSLSQCTCRKSRCRAASRAARYMSTSWGDTAISRAMWLTECGRSAVVCSGATWIPKSEPDRDWVAKSPRALPNCAPKFAEDIELNMPRIGPMASRTSSGSPLNRASFIWATTGLIMRFHAGRVLVSQSVAFQATTLFSDAGR